MSALNQAHLDIARERFLEMMAAHPDADPRQTACIAVDQANDFVAAYGVASDPCEPYEPVKLKGCKQCFGSGGKVGNPCKACGGSGKVPA